MKECRMTMSSLSSEMLENKKNAPKIFCRKFYSKWCPSTEGVNRVQKCIKDQSFCTYVTRHVLFPPPPKKELIYMTFHCCWHIFSSHVFPHRTYSSFLNSIMERPPFHHRLPWRQLVCKIWKKFQHFLACKS